MAGDGVRLRLIRAIVEGNSNALKNLTDEQLEAMIEYLTTSLEAQARGSVRVIEGTAEPAAAMAPAPKPKNRLSPSKSS
jgi:hypothetical protein